MHERTKILKIVRSSLIGILPTHVVDKLAIRITDGLLLNGAKFKEVD